MDASRGETTRKTHVVVFHDPFARQGNADGHPAEDTGQLNQGSAGKTPKHRRTNRPRAVTLVVQDIARLAARQSKRADSNLW